MIFTFGGFIVLSIIGIFGYLIAGKKKKINIDAFDRSNISRNIEMTNVNKS